MTSKGADAETVEPTPSTSKPVDPMGLDPKEGITLELCAGIVDKSKVIATCGALVKLWLNCFLLLRPWRRSQRRRS